MKEINDYYNFIFPLYEIPQCTAVSSMKKFMTKNLVKIKFLENRVEMRQLKCKRKCNSLFSSFGDEMWMLNF